MDAVVSAREPQYRSGHDRSPDQRLTLGSDELRRMNAYWRAANYLSVGQIYLYDNPLLKEPLKLSHVKPLVVGHWGTTPGQNFIYVHLNRIIKKYDLDAARKPTCRRRSELCITELPATGRAPWRLHRRDGKCARMRRLNEPTPPVLPALPRLLLRAMSLSSVR
jgi:hypothetical protein